MKLYTLTCSSCGNSYYSKEAFPKHQYCKTCTLAFKAGKLTGIKEVVEWGDEFCREHGREYRARLEAAAGEPIVRRRECYPCWQSKLKE